MMRAFVVQALLAGCAIGLAAADADAADTRATAWSFDKEAVDATPRGFKAEVGTWKVVESNGKKVLAQLARNSDPTFNVVLIDTPLVKDLDLSVSLRPIDGELDRGGGLVWRARDARNYYVARYNPLENNLRVYKVEQGKRTMFQNADVPPAGAASKLRVTMTGDHIRCSLDGKMLLDVRDTTFPESGRIGLWTKADARTEFDGLTLETP